MRTLKAILLSMLLASVCGCSVSEPEGPAEQIGKGIDLITKGLQESAEQANSRAEIQRKLEEDKEREKLRQERERYYNPGGSKLNDGSAMDDWSSERKY